MPWIRQLRRRHLQIICVFVRARSRSYELMIWIICLLWPWTSCSTSLIRSWLPAMECYAAHRAIKPGTHWRQSWIQHGRLCGKSTKSTVLLWPVHTTHGQQGRPYRKQSWMYTATVDFVADLLPVSATVDFQQGRPCWIQLCRQCVPGLTAHN